MTDAEQRKAANLVMTLITTAFLVTVVILSITHSKPAQMDSGTITLDPPPEQVEIDSLRTLNGYGKTHKFEPK